MDSNFDFSTGVDYLAPLNRIQRGDPIRDDLLPRRRNQIRKKPDREDSGDSSPGDMMMSDDSGTEKHCLDLRA